MTDTLIDHADSGDIHRTPGETRMRIDTGEATQRIDPRLIKAPSYEAIPRRVIDIDDTVRFALPKSINLDLDELRATVDGELRPAAPGPRPTPPLPKPPAKADKHVLRLRKSVPYVLPDDRAPWSAPRHAAPPLWARLAVAAGLALALGSVLGLAVLAVIR
jgi:hypothetical protein